MLVISQILREIQKRKKNRKKNQKRRKKKLQKLHRSMAFRRLLVWKRRPAWPVLFLQSLGDLKHLTSWSCGSRQPGIRRTPLRVDRGLYIKLFRRNKHQYVVSWVANVGMTSVKSRVRKIFPCSGKNGDRRCVEIVLMTAMKLIPISAQGKRGGHFHRCRRVGGHV